MRARNFLRSADSNDGDGDEEEEDDPLLRRRMDVGSENDLRCLPPAPLHRLLRPTN